MKVRLSGPRPMSLPLPSLDSSRSHALSLHRRSISGITDKIEPLASLVPRFRRERPSRPFGSGPFCRVTRLPSPTNSINGIQGSERRWHAILRMMHDIRSITWCSMMAALGRGSQSLILRRSLGIPSHNRCITQGTRRSGTLQNRLAS